MKHVIEDAGAARLVGQRMAVKSGITGKQALVYGAAFAASLSIGIVNLSIVFYGNDVLGLAPFRIGVLAAMWSAAYASTCLLVRRLPENVPPRYWIVCALTLMGSSVLGMLAAPSPARVFPLYALFGASMAFFWPPLVGWLSVEAEGNVLSRLVSRFNMSWSIGAVLSPYATGFLYELNRTYPLRTAGVLLLLTALLVGGASLLLPDIRNDSSHRPSHRAGIADASTAYRYPAWMGLWATYFGMGILTTVFPLAARNDAGLSETRVGLGLLGLGLCNFVGFTVLGRMKAWHFRVAPMAGALLARGIAFALLAYARSFGSTAGLMAVFGFTMAMGYTSSIYHGASGSLCKTRRMAVHETIISSSIMVGVLCGGALYQVLSARTVYLSVALISVATAAAQTVVARQLRSR